MNHLFYSWNKQKRTVFSVTMFTIVVLLLIAIFILDLYLITQNVIVPTLYLLVLFLTLLIPNRFSTLLIMVLSVIFIGAAYFFHLAIYSDTLPNIINRIIAVALILLSALIILKVKRSTNDLLQTEERFQRIIESSPSAMIIINKAGNIIFHNPQAEQLFGFQSGELKMMQIEQLIPKRFRRSHPKYRKFYHSNPTVRKMGMGRDLYGLRKDGSEIPIEIGLAPINIDDDLLVLATITDITQRKKSENNMLKLSSELQRSNDELNAFAYTVSHDLKEPLRGIYNYAEFLDQDFKDKFSSEGLKILNSLKEQTNHLKELIDSLLYYSRLGRGELEFCSIDPKHIIAKVQQSLSVLIKSRNVKFNIHDICPEFYCDPIRMTEVFQNLISNGIRYNNNEQPIIEIGCLKSKNPLQDEITFFIRDNGIGIEDQYIDKIFLMFKRFHKIENYESGLGVGLTIVKKIIERHHGKIWLESTLGEGTTFYFSIPQNIPKQNPSALLD